MQLHSFDHPDSATPGGAEVSTPVLSDAALSAAGMVKVSAFVRGETTAQAKRTRKHRARSTEMGHRQVNVMAPEAAHATIKAIAENLRAGCSIRSALERVLALEASANGGARSAHFKHRPVAAGWRRLLKPFLTALRAAARKLKPSR
jgi:hypothetical protein